MYRYSEILLLASVALVSALPQQTPAPTTTAPTPSTTPPPSTITSSASLSCSSGSTVLHTTDCTYGFPTSYCYSPPPPIQCSSGYYPGVWHPGHCLELSTCYALDSPWITSSCTDGQQPYSTSTLYSGTLAGGTSTVIEQTLCACNSDMWYSWSSTNVYCMPRTNCGAGMTTSTSTNQYCATAPPASCSSVPLTTEYCVCESPDLIPSYTSGAATPTGCFTQ